MELLKYVYFCAQNLITKAENSKFPDLINAPLVIYLFLSTCSLTLTYCKTMERDWTQVINNIMKSSPLETQTVTKELYICIYTYLTNWVCHDMAHK